MCIFVIVGVLDLLEVLSTLDLVKNIHFVALSKNILSPESEAQTLPQSVQTHHKNGGLSIGIPKEVTFQENRVPLTPAAVAYFTSNGHQIVIESGAGRNANFSDIQFSEAGAQIVYSNKEVYQCETILKIDPPTLSEIELMKTGQLLISALQINQMDSVLLRKLMEKKIKK